MTIQNHLFPIVSAPFGILMLTMNMDHSNDHDHPHPHPLLMKIGLDLRDVQRWQAPRIQWYRLRAVEGGDVCVTVPSGGLDCYLWEISIYNYDDDDDDDPFVSIASVSSGENFSGNLNLSARTRRSGHSRSNWTPARDQMLCRLPRFHHD